MWWSGTWQAADSSIDVAAELEGLGYGALWSSGGFNPGLSSRFRRFLESTKRLVVASGIVSIWVSPAEEIAKAADALEQAYPGRFLLGIGASHGPIVQDYHHPYLRMIEYLDGLDAATPTVPPERRVLAALRPRMLELAATRSAGAHPYFVPVEHTARARATLGEGVLLVPEVTVVLESDATRARELARSFTTGYLTLPNYVNNLRSLGFTEDDVAGGGSDRLVDAVVGWGDLERVAGRIREHLDAGADHVCVQVVSETRDVFPLDEYRRLAQAVFG